MHKTLVLTSTIVSSTNCPYAVSPNFECVITATHSPVCLTAAIVECCYMFDVAHKSAARARRACKLDASDVRSVSGRRSSSSAVVLGGLELAFRCWRAACNREAILYSLRIVSVSRRLVDSRIARPRRRTSWDDGVECIH